MLMDYASGSRLRILLVDDHAETIRALDRLLNALGYQVRSAGSVGEAITLARKNQFDLLISDIQLPDGTGMDLMRQMNTARPTRGIAVSGYDDEDDRRDCRNAGFDAHLTKPTDLPRLLATIQQVMTN